MTLRRLRGHAVSEGGSSRRFPIWASLLVALALGALAAVQSRVNGELGRGFDDGFVAAAISVSSGLLIIVVVMVFFPAGRTGLRGVLLSVSGGRVPFWYLLGGFAGGLVVLSQGLTASILGVALFTIAIVAGQTIAGILIDRIGLVGHAKRPLTARRVCGAALALVAVAWAVSPQLRGDIPVWLLVLPFIAGIGIAWQIGVNGAVRGIADSTLTATFVNSATSTVALVAVMLVHACIAGWPQQAPTDPWLYIGGAIGCVLVAVEAALMRITGVLLLALGTIAGQLVTSLLLDLVAPTSGPVQFPTVAGTALVLVAVIVVSGLGGRIIDKRVRRSLG